MTDPDNPIPDYVREPFEQAVAAFQHWQYGDAEPPISFGHQRQLNLESICEYASVFSGEVPNFIFDIVTALAADFRAGSEQIDHNCAGPADKSYREVALCLYRLVGARRDYFKRRDQQLSG
jgi:hypothetical protein